MNHYGLSILESLGIPLRLLIGRMEVKALTTLDLKVEAVKAVHVGRGAITQASSPLCRVSVGLQDGHNLPLGICTLALGTFTTQFASTPIFN